MNKTLNDNKRHYNPGGFLQNNKLARYAVRLLNTVHFPGLSKITLYDVLRSLFRQIREEAINVRAAAISFDFMMAVPAFFIFVASLIPYLPASRELFNELISFIEQMTPDMKVHSRAFGYLDTIFNRPSRGLLSAGMILSFYYSSRAMMGVINSFDRSARNRSKTNFIKKRSRAMLLTIVVILLLIATMLVMLGQGALFKNVMDWLSIENNTTKMVIKNSRWVVIIALFYFSIAIIYKYGPSVKQRGKLNTVGAWVATALIIVVTLLFTNWAQNFSMYNKVYGPVGSLMLMMLLIYIDSLMLLVGFELNNSIAYIEEEMQNYPG